MAKYTIVKKQQATAPSLAGGFQQVWKITYQTDDGTVGTVTVPDGPIWAQAAAEAIDAQLKQFDELHNLGQ